jgi:low temperature requirement protein LtrA
MRTYTHCCIPVAVHLLPAAKGILIKDNAQKTEKRNQLMASKGELT